MKESGDEEEGRKSKSESDDVAERGVDGRCSDGGGDGGGGGSVRRWWNGDDEVRRSKWRSRSSEEDDSEGDEDRDEQSVMSAAPASRRSPFLLTVAMAWTELKRLCEGSREDEQKAVLRTSHSGRCWEATVKRG